MNEGNFDWLFEVLMDIVGQFLEFTRVLAWPAVVVFVCVFFRTALVKLLERLSKAKLPGGTEIEFAEQLKEVEEAGKDVQRQSESKKQHQHVQAAQGLPLTNANKRMLELGLRVSPSGLEMEYYRDLARTDPSIALAGVRIEIEILARNLAKWASLNVTSKTPLPRLLGELVDANAITIEQRKLASSLIQVCNMAVHGGPISTNQADSVIDSAKILARQYHDWLTWGFTDDLGTESPSISND